MKDGEYRAEKVKGGEYRAEKVKVASFYTRRLDPNLNQEQQ